MKPKTLHKRPSGFIATTDDDVFDHTFAALREIKRDHSKTYAMLRGNSVLLLSWNKTKAYGGHQIYLGLIELEFLVRAIRAKTNLVAPRLGSFSALAEMGLVRGERRRTSWRRKTSFVCRLTQKGKRVMSWLRKLVPLLRLGAGRAGAGS